MTFFGNSHEVLRKMASETPFLGSGGFFDEG
jgi:hypothetical protein